MKTHSRRQRHQMISRLPQASAMALAIPLLFPAAAQSAEYLASDMASFNAAIAKANADGDTNAVIKLTADITTLSPMVSTVPITIDTQGFKMIGGPSVGATNYGALTMPNQYTFKGTFVGVDVAAGTAGVGLGFNTTSLTGDPSSRSVIIDGNVTGGAQTGGGTGGAGIAFLQGAKTLINNGNIKGGQGTSGGLGVSLSTNNALINSGTIEGGEASTGNGGTGIGVSGSLPGASIINSGTIRGGISASGAGGAGIRFTGGSGLSIQNTGTIEGGSGTAAITATTGRFTIINSGAITAGAGANAMTFATTTSLSLELRAGSNITGNVVAASGTADVLTFGGSADASFDVSKIGDTAQYQSFDSIVKTGSSTWTLNNTMGIAAIAPSWTINEGKLALNGAVTGAMTVNAAGTLGGNATVNGDVTNSGTIAPGNSIGTVFINGNYTGNGGMLEIEGQFAGTGSPADKLLISGNATGTTTIKTINVGGTGAATGTGNTDGISIIQVAGASSANAFQLAGGYAAAGPYQYKLNMFDPTTSAAGQVDPLLGATPFYDYRLQSLLDANGNPVAVPQIAGYQGMSTGAVRYGASLLDSVHQRLGELRRLAAAGNGNDDGKNHEFFLRAQGSSNDVSGNHASGYDQDIWFTQAGGNVFGKDMEDGAKWRIGGAFSYGESKLNVNGSSAKVNLDGTSLALTSTYQAAAGGYLDGIAQLTRYSADIRTSERGQTGSPDGSGYALSLGGGYPFDLGGGLVIEPQAQLAYQKIKFDRFTDVDGIDVDVRDGESLRGRFGGRVQKTFDAHTTHAWSPFMEVNLLHEFLGNGGIRADGVSFASDSLGTGVQLGGGINAQFGANKSVFASVSYESGLSDAAADAWSGNVGIRIDF